MLKTLRSRRSCFLPGVVALALSLSCSSEPKPKDSTETGNPPFLDLKLVDVQGEAEQAYIVGQPGAVSPPTGIVTAVELRTGNLFQAPVQADGSFEIAVSPAEGFFYVVTGDVVDRNDVLLQAARDPEGIVTLGELSVEDTLRALNLTCGAERLAAQGAVSREASKADRACSVDADCTVTSLENACAPACDRVAMSSAAAARFEMFKAELLEDVCPAHAQGECSTPQVEPCPEANLQAVAKCRFGLCSVEAPDLAQECGGPAINVAWVRYETGSSPDAQPTFSYTGLWYGGLEQLHPDGTRCGTTLARCGSSEADLDFALRAAALHPDVQSAVAQGGVRHEATGDTRVQVEIQTYSATSVRLDFAICEGCGVPEGFLALARVLLDMERASCAAEDGSGR